MDAASPRELSRRAAENKGRRTTDKSMTMNDSSRRDFLHKTMSASAAVGFAFPTIVPGRALGLGGAVAPSKRITLAVIGTGNQGFNDINAFLRDDRVQMVAVCYVNRCRP